MHLLFAALLALTQPWLIVSDLHVEPFDRSPQVSDYGADTNWALLDSTIAAMRKTEPNPAVVVIPGDFLAHHFDSKVHAANAHLAAAAAAEQEMRAIESRFARAFPRAQFVIAMGNNDDPCGDYSTAPDTAYLSQVARIWQPLVDRGSAAPDFVRAFSHGGYYAAKLPGGKVRAIVLNSVYWSILYHPCNGAGSGAGAAQLKWLQTQLAPRNGRAIVVMHIPPGVDGSSTLLTHRFLVVPFLQGGADAAFERIMSASRARVPFAIAGHLHLNDFRLAGGVAMLIAGSVSPVYHNNPSFIRALVSSDGTLQDYRMYGYDIDSGAWAQVLDFDRAYGTSAFDTAALSSVHERLEDDPNLRSIWEHASSAGSADLRIDRGNWLAFWCAQTGSGSAYTTCAGDRRRAAVLPLGLALAGIVAILIVIAIVLRLASQRRRT